MGSGVRGSLDQSRRAADGEVRGEVKRKVRGEVRTVHLLDDATIPPKPDCLQLLPLQARAPSRDPLLKRQDIVVVWLRGTLLRRLGEGGSAELAHFVLQGVTVSGMKQRSGALATPALQIAASWPDIARHGG